MGSSCRSEGKNEELIKKHGHIARPAGFVRTETFSVMMVV